MVIFRSKWRARERKTEEKRRDVQFFCPRYHWPTESIFAWLGQSHSHYERVTRWAERV
jgi:hypothetical protein